MSDIIITPASGKIDFYQDLGGSSLAKIELTNANDLALSTTSGNLIIGDASRDVYIGDGVNNVDIVFEQNGEIRPLSAKTLVIGASGAYTEILATKIGINKNSLGSIPLDVYSSVSGSTLFNIAGTNGNLFRVTDSLSGSLMSVNNSAGLPVFEVFSDDRVVAGRFGQNDFIMTSGGNVGIGTGVPSSKFHVVGISTFGGDVSSTGSFIAGLGSASNPSFEFNGDTDTGMFAPSGDILAFATSGVERVRINNIGNIGIGTTSPSVQLDVAGSGRFTGRCRVNNLTINTDTITDNTAPYLATMLLGSDGASLSGGGLQITTNTNRDANKALLGLVNNKLKTLSGASTFGKTTFSSEYNADTSVNSTQTPNGNFVNVLTLESGNLTLINQNLYIKNSPTPTAYDNNAGTIINSQAYIYMQGASAVSPARFNNIYNYYSRGQFAASHSYATNFVDFYAAPIVGQTVPSGGITTRTALLIDYYDGNTAYITNPRGIWQLGNNVTNYIAGSLGIGTTNPSGQLHVVGSSVFGGDISSTGSFIAGSGSASNPSFEFTSDTDTGMFTPSGNIIGFATSGVERVRIDNVGRVGIGTTSPIANLSVTGNAVFGETGSSIGATVSVKRIGNNYNLELVGATDGVTNFAVLGGSTNMLWTSRANYFDIQTNTAGKGLALTTNGGSLFLSSSGNVGIGLNNPSYPLHFTSGLVSGYLYFGNDGSNIFAAGPNFNITTNDTLNLKIGTATALIADADGYDIIIPYGLSICKLDRYYQDWFDNSDQASLFVSGTAYVDNIHIGGPTAGASPGFFGNVSKSGHAIFRSLGVGENSDTPGSNVTMDSFGLIVNNGGGLGGQVFRAVSDSGVYLESSLIVNSNNYSAARVGIGTSNPLASLDVDGSGNFTGNLVIGGNLTINGTVVTANIDRMEVEDPILTLGLASGNIVTDINLDRGLALIRNSSTTAFMGWDTSASQFVMLSSGVASNSSGIYSTGTYGNLQINNLTANSGNFTRNIVASGFVLSPLPPGTNTASLLTAGGGAIDQAALVVSYAGAAGSASSATNLDGGLSGQIPYQTNTGATSFISAGSSGQFLVSRGASSPIWASDPVVGTGTANYIAYWTSSSGLSADVNQLYWDSTNNRLGIGTASPGHSLHVQGGDINTSSGFRIGGSGANGQYLRGNGTRFVSSTIQAADVPTLNQNTTGSAATLTTTRTLWGQNFDGSANVTGSLSNVGDISATGTITINNSGVALYDTTVFNLGTISGTNSINCGQDRQIQTLTLNGTATTFTKGTGWPTSNNVARETTLNIFSSGNTSITWTIVNDWYRQPDSPLPSGRHIVLLRSVGSGTMQGHYIGNKTN